MRGRQHTEESGQRLAAIESLRGLAAISVLLFHFSQSHPVVEGGVLARILAHLNFGVVVFFVISGFVLYLPFIELRRRGERKDLGAYALRRLARIAPAYWVALVVVALLDPAAGAIREQPLTYLAFAQIYDGDTVLWGLGVAWTLDVEIAFYALLPALAGIIAVVTPRLRAAPWLVIGALVAASLAWTAAQTPPGRTGARTVVPDLGYFWLPRFLLFFAIGMALAEVAVRARTRPWPPAARSPWPWLVGTAAGFLAVSEAGLTGVAADIVNGVAAGALVGLAVFCRPTALPRRVLATRSLVFLGTVSYGIYLYHVVVMRNVDLRLGELPAAAALLLTLAGAIVAGTASHLAIERPAMRWARERRRRRGPAPVPLGVVPTPHPQTSD